MQDSEGNLLMLDNCIYHVQQLTVLTSNPISDIEQRTVCFDESCMQVAQYETVHPQYINQTPLNHTIFT